MHLKWACGKLLEFQAMGENSLAVVVELSQQLALRRHKGQTATDTENAVFFDVLGKFMVISALQNLQQAINTARNSRVLALQHYIAIHSAYVKIRPGLLWQQGVNIDCIRSHFILLSSS